MGQDPREQLMIDLSLVDEDMTVEQFLHYECEMEIRKLRLHVERLIEHFRAEAAIVRERMIKQLSAMDPKVVG